MTILRFTRAEVYAMSQQGLMNIKALEHWDACNDLSNGMDYESIAMKYRKSTQWVEKIKGCKCPQ